MTNLVQIPEDIRQEFSVESDGKIFANSHRGISRLCGLNSNSPVKNILKNIADQKNLSKPLQPFAGQRFKADQKLPDILVGAIIVHYALKGREEAINCMMAFNSIGIRSWFQEQLGWQPETKPEKPMSPAELAVHHANLLLDHEQRLNQHDVAIEKAYDKITLFEVNYNLMTSVFDNMTQQFYKLTRDMGMQDELYKKMLAGEKPDEYDIKEVVKHLIKRYAVHAKISYAAAWNKAYNELKLRYKFDVFPIATRKGTQKLDEVEKAGYMKELHICVSEMIVSLSRKTYGEVSIEQILNAFF